MKKLFCLMLAAAMLLGLLSGCGNNTSNNSGSGSEDGVITIEYWNSAEGAMATSTEYLVKQFNDTVGKEKGIVVHSVFQGGDVMEKLKTLAQANDYGNFPDVGQIYSAGVPTLVTMDPLYTMSEVYDSGKFDIMVKQEDIIENFLRTYQYDGELIGMPLNASSMLMYYNKDAVREAGLDPDAPPATIAELADWTDKLTVRNSDGRDGMMTKLTIGEDGSLMTFLNEWEKVIATGGYKAVNDDERGEFANGLSAINFQSSSQLATMFENTEGKFELGVAPLPACSSDYNAGASVGGGSLCMFDLGSEERLQAAWEFVQFMVSPESQMYLFQNNGYLPVCSAAYDSEAYAAFIQERPEAAVAVEQLQYSDIGMQEPLDLINWELNTLSKENFIAWTNGEISKQECHDNIVDGFNAKLTEYIRANG